MEYKKENIIDGREEKNLHQWIGWVGFFANEKRILEANFLGWNDGGYPMNVCTFTDISACDAEHPFIVNGNKTCSYRYFYPMFAPEQDVVRQGVVLVRREKGVMLNSMARSALDIATVRGTKGQLKSDTFSILKHCAGEVVEAVDAYSEYAAYGHDADSKEAFADELSDIITCALIAAAQENIDIEESLERVQIKNARRAGL